MNYQDEINTQNAVLNDPQKYIKDVHSMPSTILLRSIIDQ